MTARQVALDDLKEVLEGWKERAQEELDFIQADVDRDTRYPEERRSERATLANRMLEVIPEVIAAAESNDICSAIDRAVMLGILSGLAQAWPSQYHVERKLRLQAPIVLRGQKNIDATDAGAAVSRKLPKREQIIREIAALRLKRPGLGERAYQEEVAKEYGATDSAVRKALKKKQ